ncbi:MAG TPA: hypothetical protein VGL82_12315 [Bryobacteraceae bacterium]
MYAANNSGSVDADAPTRGRSALRHALAGLQAGVLGALLLFACLMLGSLWNGRSIWVTPNLFASTFFGSEVYRNQFLRTSWIGLALVVAIYGALGSLWGCIWRDKPRRWLALYGAIAGLGIYFLFFDVLWPHVNGLITLYAPNRQLQVGHVLWGMMLARSPLYARRIADSTSDSKGDDSPKNDSAEPFTNIAADGQAVNPSGVYEVAAEEVRSGETIQ